VATVTADAKGRSACEVRVRGRSVAPALAPRGCSAIPGCRRSAFQLYFLGRGSLWSRLAAGGGVREHTIASAKSVWGVLNDARRSLALFEHRYGLHFISAIRELLGSIIEL
jgi:hypothetical protein